METNVSLISGWTLALKAARRTVSKLDIDKEPSSKFKLQMLYAEHSPIRTVRYWIDWDNIKRWVTAHLTRHKIGFEPFVGTMRTDRTGINRDDRPQAELSVMSADINAQAMINISRKRLCNKTSLETREAWQEMINQLKVIDPELAIVQVPECIYRGFCPEPECCGFENTSKFINLRMNYISRCKNARGAK